MTRPTIEEAQKFMRELEDQILECMNETARANMEMENVVDWAAQPDNVMFQVRMLCRFIVMQFGREHVPGFALIQDLVHEIVGQHKKEAPSLDQAFEAFKRRTSHPT